MTCASRRNFLKTAGKMALVGLGASPVIGALLSGCKAMDTVAGIGTSLGVATGAITDSQAESIRKSVTVVARTFEDITPEQEYYIGRTVGAVILSKYPPYRNPASNRYINMLGKTLAQASDRPETFGGYHFLIQNSQEINALSAPGGWVFITRGMLRCCRNEDAAAAVLAHEIAHVQLKHGLQSIQKSRVTQAVTTLAVEGTKTFGGEQLADLTRTFEGSISDITQTLINSGYSRAFEQEADLTAVTILKRVGYDPNGLADMLRGMEARLKPGGLDFAKTHPSPASRIAQIRGPLGEFRPVIVPKARQARFSTALKNV